ncbi:MAG: PQQ-dependent sugar dehydrogenase [Bacteroidia bacterium]
MKRILTLLLFAAINSYGQFTTTTIVSGLQYPVAFDWMPNGNYLITLKGGSSFPAVNAKIQVYSPAGVFLNTFYNLTDSVNADFERGLLGVCVDPDFASNHYVYAYYNHNYNGDERIRIIKFTEAANIGTNPILLLDIDVSNGIAGNHVGGNLHMHASEPDKLYFVIGDIAVMSNAQLLTNPYGKVLRINTDGSIPTDNPFYDNGNPLSGNDDRIWSYGHRNPFDFCFSPVNDSIYVAENGLNTWDEANFIHKGANYGWSTCEGNYLIGSTTSPCTNPSFTNPITTWGAPVPSVTGILVYNSTIISQFTNHMLVADNNYGRVYNCTLGNPPLYNTVTSNVLWMDLTTSGGLTTIRQGTDGCIYAMKGGYTTAGVIYRICPTGLYVNEITSTIIDAGIFPNPSSAESEIRFILNQEDVVKIFIADVTGRIVHTVYQGRLLKGEQKMLSDNSLFANGTYLCHIETAAGLQIMKMVVMK